MNQEVNFDNEERDALYFNLIIELAEKNHSRYQLLTEHLLKHKKVNTYINGANIEFKLTPLGCSFQSTHVHGNRNAHSWSRMGWRKSAKRKALPQYFARAEATVIIDQAG